MPSKVVALIFYALVATVCVVYLNSQLLSVWVPIAIALLPCSVIMFVKSFTDDQRVQLQIKTLESDVEEFRKVLKSTQRRFRELEDSAAGTRVLCECIQLDLENTKVVLDLSDLVDGFEKATRDHLKGLTMELHRRNFTIMWNSLPFSDRFHEFDERTKALYFDAITKGDWSKLNTRLRK